jgi:hypothetical protein
LNQEDLLTFLIDLDKELYMKYAIVQADLLDKQGHMIMEGLGDGTILRTHTTGQSLPSFPNLSDPAILVYRDVQRRQFAYEKLQLAFVIYRRLLHSTELQWGSSSLEHCWVANRLGFVLETFGLRNEALDLYVTSCSGRVLGLGPRHRATKESLNRVKLLQDLMRAE